MRMDAAGYTLLPHHVKAQREPIKDRRALRPFVARSGGKAGRFKDLHEKTSEVNKTLLHIMYLFGERKREETTCMGVA